MARHNELGRMGENVAARYLIQQGYNIVARDWRFGHRDIDIVAAKEGVLVFVEVKTRATAIYGQPEEAVDNRKIRSLLAAGSAYVRYFNVESPVRFDVIAVVGEHDPFEVTHIENAINPNSLSYYGHDFTPFSKHIIFGK